MADRLNILNELHRRAWGKQWPTTTCSIHRCDIPDKIEEIYETDETDETDSDEDSGDMDMDDANNTDDDGDNFDDKVPTETTFTCLLNVDQLLDALEISGEFSLIVILNEYEFLREFLEEETGPFIVTGQPGTGKTVFLLYLLIYRLQLALPTAVQFLPYEYIVFKADGVLVCSTTDINTNHRSILPPGCWCLSDGNADVTHPCAPFRRRGLRTFLITSPRLERYKIWRTEVDAETVVTALPREVEVAAIAKMDGYDPSDAVSLVRKWGPCTRTVLSILRKPNQEDKFRSYAIDAARDICYDPSKVSLHDDGQLPSGHSSTLFFIRPIRFKDKPTYRDSKLIIPTTYLSEIYGDRCQGLSIQNRMKLYELFSMHAMTRSPAGVLHVKTMHLQMMAMGSKRYEIFNDGVKSYMNSATAVPVGTASALRDNARKTSSSFYWYPDVVNYPGIDGILVNGNNIYALQATISDTHRGPREGLKKVWQTIGAKVARLFTWHFVMVTDTNDLANKYVKNLGTVLPDVLGVKVSLWVCTIKSELGGGGSGTGIVGVPTAFSGMP